MLRNDAGHVYAGILWMCRFTGKVGHKYREGGFCGYNATVFHASGSQLGPLAWSDQIKCQTGGRGKYYRVCQEYGRANSCDKGGATTCVCGVNCE